MKQTCTQDHDADHPAGRGDVGHRWRLLQTSTWPAPLHRRLLSFNLAAALITGAIGLGVIHTHGDTAFPIKLIWAVAGVGSQTSTLAAVGDFATGPAPKAFPTGKGMWLYEFDHSENGDASAIVARARAAGLTHLYVRAGSWKDGFYASEYLNRLLPVAHAAGLTVYGWDFPRLGAEWPQDVARALAIVNYLTPDGHHLDGFSADIETQSEGTRISGPVALAYGRELRRVVGPDVLLIATVPRPSSSQQPAYPYAEVVEQFDAIAPMVYWLNRQPDSDVAGAMADLLVFGKPVFPVGQAYDGEPEGGRAGVPTSDELRRFIAAADAMGAGGVSFWSWQAADQRAWDAIRDAPEFR